MGKFRRLSVIYQLNSKRHFFIVKIYRVSGVLGVPAIVYLSTKYYKGKNFHS